MIRLLPAGKYLRTFRALVRNRLTGTARYPFYASFKLTSRCHFNCAFCNIKDETRPDLSTDAVCRILDNLSRSSVILVSFEGGEPLLRPDIGELLRYAKKKAFYLLFTTSERKLERYPMKEYASDIDFLHISVDEGHNNLELLDRLDEFMEFGTQLSIQTVVTSETLPMLEAKAARCFKAKANMVVMPAVHMNRTENHLPDLGRFEAEILRLKRAYPKTIWTPDGYFDAVREGRCNTASVIIDSDGRLYYPCHIRETHGPDLAETDLMGWLAGPDAEKARADMRACGRRCGWYQYFSTAEFTQATTALKSLLPAFSKGFRRHP